MNIEDFRILDAAGNIFNISLTQAEPPAPPPEDDIWAEDGFSKEARYGVAFMYRPYNELLDDMIANGDEYDRKAASEAKRWLCLWVPGRDMSEEQLNLIRANFNRSIATQGGAFIGRMMHMYGFYLSPDNKVDEVSTPCIGFNFRDVYKNLDLLAHNISNKAAYYRSRREGMPQPIADDQ